MNVDSSINNIYMYDFMLTRETSKTGVLSFRSITLICQIDAAYQYLVQPDTVEVCVLLAELQIHVYDDDDDSDDGDSNSNRTR